MVDSPNQTGQGFGWAVLFFGACWLFASAALLVQLQLVTLSVLKLLLAVTLVWAVASVASIATGWSPGGK